MEQAKLKEGDKSEDMGKNQTLVENKKEEEKQEVFEGGGGK